MRDEKNSFLLNVEKLKRLVRKIDGSKLLESFDSSFSLFHDALRKIFQHVDRSDRSKILVGGEYEKTGLVLKRCHGV